ncbi:hypothetical protein [Clostridiisalibacter paucivorans]|uniref:hypothetical protein n=1 Tax=Clostridiisalibacter paucivorans TaxID=408753 RepID=UPI00047D6494|nr:hypothetical protein [Clostridiisalibacter paucivorans]
MYKGDNNGDRNKKILNNSYSKKDIREHESSKEFIYNKLNVLGEELNSIQKEIESILKSV